MALTFFKWDSCDGLMSCGMGRAAAPAASKACEDGAGHAEEAGRKPRMIGDIEVDEPVHGR